MPALGQSHRVPIGFAARRRWTVDTKQIGQVIGRQISTISIHLAKLRNADVVRYDTSGKETRYWLKHKSEIKGLLRMLEKVVDASVRIE